MDAIKNYFNAMGQIQNWYNGSCPSKAQIWGLTAAAIVVAIIGFGVAWKQNPTIGFVIIVIAVLGFLFTGAGLYNACSAPSPAQS